MKCYLGGKKKVKNDGDRCALNPLQSKQTNKQKANRYIIGECEEGQMRTTNKAKIHFQMDLHPGIAPSFIWIQFKRKSWTSFKLVPAGFV